MANTIRPAHADQKTASGLDREMTTGTTRWQTVVGVLGLVAVLWVGRELSDVVTSGAARPSGGTPPAVDQAPPSGGQAPPVGAHDPSQFNH